MQFYLNSNTKRIEYQCGAELVEYQLIIPEKPFDLKVHLRRSNLTCLRKILFLLNDFFVFKFRLQYFH